MNRIKSAPGIDGNPEPESLDALASEWSRLKQLEQDLYDQRIEVEREIDQLLAYIPQESSKSIGLANGSKLKLTRKLNYKVDLLLLEMLTADWPEDIRPIKTKTVADETMLKHIRKESPTAWSKIARAIETKPAKVNISIDSGEK